MKHKAIIVFTGRNPDEIVSEGGSQAWALNPQRARECEYLVCTQNRKAGDWAHPTESHGEAFLIGKVSGVVRSKELSEANRYLIQISEYARVKIPNAWKGERNPVRYVALEDLKIDLATLSFERVPENSSSSVQDQTAAGDLQMEKHMEGVTGWFSYEEPTTDCHLASLNLSDDATITISVHHSDGLWTISLRHDPRWALLNGEAFCGDMKATVTWAFIKEHAPRKWRLTGEWIEGGQSYHWWADLVETAPCRERIITLVGQSLCGGVVTVPQIDPSSEGLSTAGEPDGARLDAPSQ